MSLAMRFARGTSPRTHFVLALPDMLFFAALSALCVLLLAGLAGLGPWADWLPRVLGTVGLKLGPSAGRIEPLWAALAGSPLYLLLVTFYWKPGAPPADDAELRALEVFLVLAGLVLLLACAEPVLAFARSFFDSLGNFRSLEFTPQ